MNVWSLMALLLCFWCVVTVDSYDDRMFTDKAVLKTCSVSPKDVKSKLWLENYITQHRLIKLDINVLWNDLPTGNESYPVDVEWFMTTRESGKRLLLLDKTFESLSLGTLSHGVKAMSLTLVQEPIDCLGVYTKDEANHIMYYSLLNLPSSNRTMGMDRNEDYSELQICNGYSDQPVCCRLTHLGNLDCDEHVKDKWIDIFEIVVGIMLIIALSYTPYMVPKSLYQSTVDVYTFEELSEFDRNKALPYEFILNVTKGDVEKKGFKKIYNQKVEEKTSLIGQTDQENGFGNASAGCNNSTSSIFSLIYDMLRDAEHDKMFKLRIGANSISSEPSQLVSEITAPSGLKNSFGHLMRFLTDICITCRIRNLDCLKEVCYKECCDKCYVYQCIGKVMKICVSLVCLFPIVLRFLYTNSNQDAFSFVVFLSGNVGICSIAICLVICDLKPLKQLLSGCLNFLSDSAANRAKIFMKIAKWLYSPSNKWYNIFLVICSSCLAVIYLFLSTLPYAIFIIVLTWGVIKSMHEQTKCIKNPNRSRFRSGICRIAIRFILIMCPFFFFCCYFVILDFVVFCTLCLAYTITGLIVNSTVVLPYVTALLLMSSYVYNCIKGTHTRIEKFKNALIKALLESNKELLTDAFKRSIITEQSSVSLLQYGNTAESNQNKLAICRDGTMFLKTNMLLLFHRFNSNEKLPYLEISKLFLYKMMEYPSRITPGSIYKMYFYNLRDIVIMVAILFVVLICTLSFGEVHQLSSGVQALVTAGSGIVLFIFNKLLSRSSERRVDDKGEHLKELIKIVSNQYSELWKINRFRFLDDSSEITDNRNTDTADIIVKMDLHDKNKEPEFYVNSSLSDYMHEDTQDENENDSILKIICLRYKEYLA